MRLFVHLEAFWFWTNALSSIGVEVLFHLHWNLTFGWLTTSTFWLEVVIVLSFLLAIVIAHVNWVLSLSISSNKWWLSLPNLIRDSLVSELHISGWHLAISRHVSSFINSRRQV